MIEIVYVIDVDAITPVPLAPPVPPNGLTVAFQVVFRAGLKATPNTDDVYIQDSPAGVPVGMGDTNSETLDIGAAGILPGIEKEYPDRYNLNNYYALAASGNQKVKVTATFTGSGS